MKKDEPELIRELKAGSIKAFDGIYEIYARRLYAFCLKYAKTREVAEEIVQDAFVWIWNNRQSITQEESLRPLLFIRTRHLLINAYRKVVNSPIFEDYMDYLDHSKTSSESTSSVMEYDDFLAQVNRCLEKLPGTQRKIIQLSKMEMLSNKEIAMRLNYSEQTIKNQLSIGLKQLRRMMPPPLGLLWLAFFI